MKISIFTETDLRRCVSFGSEAISVVEEGFNLLAQGKAVVPPIVSVEIPEHNGEVDIKTAYLNGLESFAVKIASGFYDNAQLNLPTSSGMMILLSTLTGFPQAVFFDNGYLTQVRTGAAGAIAAKYLACENISTVGVIGSGTQARYQIIALKEVRDFKYLKVYGDVPEQVDNYVSEMESLLSIVVKKENNPEAVVRDSDLVVTTTPSRKPYLKAAWLHPGLHITAMGSDMPEKQELFADVFTKADLIICDRKEQCRIRGELHHALEESCLQSDNEVIELGEIISGHKHGRCGPEEITICDLTGVGVQDTAIALYAYKKAQELNLGFQIEIIS